MFLLGLLAATHFLARRLRLTSSSSADAPTFRRQPGQREPVLQVRARPQRGARQRARARADDGRVTRARGRVAAGCLARNLARPARARARRCAGAQEAQAALRHLQQEGRPARYVRPERTPQQKKRLMEKQKTLRSKEEDEEKGGRMKKKMKRKEEEERR